jgi:hypothetical protein
LASTAFFVFGKNAMGEHMLFHNQHIRIMQDIPVEPAAFYEVVFVKLQTRRRVNLPGRWIGFAILEIGKTTIHPASIFCSCSLRLYAGGFLERWGNVAPEQPSIRAGERHQTPHIVYARERWRSTW